MQILKKNIDELKENEYNPNEIPPEKFQALVENIKKFGYLQPILIDEKNVIIDGAHRVRACKESGIKEIECVVYDGKTDIKEYRKLLTLSMNNLRGMNNDEKFESIIKDLAYSLDYEELESLTGFNVNEISKIVNMNIFNPEYNPEQKNKLINDNDIINGENKLGNLIEDRSNKILVVCNKCGHEFYIDGN